jgi:hypothetical protein
MELESQNRIEVFKLDLKSETESIGVKFSVYGPLVNPQVLCRLSLKSGSLTRVIQSKFEEGTPDETYLESCFLAMLYASSTNITRDGFQPDNARSRFDSYDDFISFTYSCRSWFVSAKSVDDDVVSLSIVPKHRRKGSADSDAYIEMAFDRKELFNFSVNVLKFFEELSIKTGKYDVLCDYSLSSLEMNRWKINCQVADHLSRGGGLSL